MEKYDYLFQITLYGLMWLVCHTLFPDYYPNIEVCISIILQGVYMAAYRLFIYHARSTKLVFALVFTSYLITWSIVISLFPRLIFFIPSIILHLIAPAYLILLFIFVLLFPLIISLKTLPVLIIGLISLLAYTFNQLSMRLMGQQKSYHLQIDQLRQKNYQIRQEQQRLISIQHSLKEETMLTERRRLINEIHDILGHQLSGAIIQLAAIEYIIDAPDIREKIQNTRQVLDQGMSNIRKIIHHERDTSIDLRVEVDALVQDFIKCPIHYLYHIQTPPSPTTAYGIIQIIKEALTNINKHSNASHVKLHLKEIQKQWIILIYDNGEQLADPNLSSGIGLLSMEERVLALDGRIHIQAEHGFRIFITIPMGEEDNT